MATNRFPLFRLPFLPLCMILDLYGPHEIIQLSLCSKQSLRVAKKCWKKKEKITADLCAKKIPTFNLHFHETAFFYRFVIFEAHDAKDQQVQHVRIGDAVVPSIHMLTETITYWNDRIFGIGQIVSYIKDLFDVPITKIDLNSKLYKNEFIDTMDCIMKIQESVLDCVLRGEGPIDDCLTHLLDNCKIAGELLIYGEPTRQFRNDWEIHLDTIYISNGSSLTFQNLTNIECKSLNLYCSSLTSEDLNQFLKHCMRNYTTIKRGGLDIQRNDGTIGTVFMFHNFFEFGVDPIKVFSD
ncbi:hypothetical protein CAEBREN_10974 [Caenorhabditis brenneri]|uniref:Sdz-33 F-box domain-containing protein n=1 Tax=Caenorhabditis brenneri TaxID=135651 RepID=G0NHH2_CAEBE|nr:hypothetical protein CAEBREN_10974 [Caenorhabditis brenneri]